MLLAKTLKEKHRMLRDAEPESLRLRIHRAISWLDRAEKSEDTDSQFIFLWIAFNSAYSQETGEFTMSDGRKFNAFLEKIVQLDQQNFLHKVLWEEFTQGIRVLLDNKYVYQPFWNHHNGIKGYEDWQQRFHKAKQSAQIAIVNQDTVSVLNIVFKRLYTLRNQIIHGGATYASRTNRQQLKDATQILGKIVPTIIEIMMNYPEQIWGEACYPVVE